MTDTIVKIKLDKELYESYSEVTGAIEIKTREPICVSKINLLLTKKLKINIKDMHNIEKAESNEVNLNEIVYKYDFEIYNNNDPLFEISSGHHKFPFRFWLKKTDKGSTEIKGVYFDVICDILSKYTITTNIYFIGAHNPVYVVEKELNVIDKIQNNTKFNTIVKISSPFCFFSKKYNILFEHDKPLYYSGDNIHIAAYIPQKTSSVSSIECYLYEIIKINADGKDILRSKYVIGGDNIETNDNSTYKMTLKLPSSAPSTVYDEHFSFQTVIFLIIKFKKGLPIKVKKYINVVKKEMIYPEFDYLNVLEGETFPEKIFILS